MVQIEAVPKLGTYHRHRKLRHCPMTLPESRINKPTTAGRPLRLALGDECFRGAVEVGFRATEDAFVSGRNKETDALGCAHLVPRNGMPQMAYELRN